MVEMRKEGRTLADIGHTLHVTKVAVWQHLENQCQCKKWIEQTKTEALCVS